MLAAERMRDFAALVGRQMRVVLAQDRQFDERRLAARPVDAGLAA